MIPAAVMAIFEPVWKFRAHVTELVLIIVAIILTGVYMNMAPFFGRGDIMVIAMVRSAAQNTHPKDASC